MSRDVSFSTAFADALRGSECHVVGLGGEPYRLPVDRWSGPIDEGDLALLDLCHGPTLDIGCGPGRLTEALARRGQIVLGIDVVAEAVVQTNRRGAAALRRNVFFPIPAEGRWQTALLADGNVGIGGDPVALLRRASELVTPTGRVVVEVAEPGVETQVVWAELHADTGRSRPFRWAVVSADDLWRLATEAELSVTVMTTAEGRWFGVLDRESA